MKNNNALRFGFLPLPIIPDAFLGSGFVMETDEMDF